MISIRVYSAIALVSLFVLFGCRKEPPVLKSEIKTFFTVTSDNFENLSIPHINGRNLKANNTPMTRALIDSSRVFVDNTSQLIKLNKKELNKIDLLARKQGISFIVNKETGLDDIGRRYEQTLGVKEDSVEGMLKRVSIIDHLVKQLKSIGKDDPYDENLGLVLYVDGNASLGKLKSFLEVASNWYTEFFAMMKVGNDLVRVPFRFGRIQHLGGEWSDATSVLRRKTINSPDELCTLQEVTITQAGVDAKLFSAAPIEDRNLIYEFEPLKAQIVNNMNCINKVEYIRLKTKVSYHEQRYLNSYDNCLDCVQAEINGNIVRQDGISPHVSREKKSLNRCELKDLLQSIAPISDGCGYLAISALNLLGIELGLPAWQPFLVGGILGALLAYPLFEWALIALSSLTGALLIAQALDVARLLALAIFAVAFVFGVAVQAGVYTRLWKRRREAG